MLAGISHDLRTPLARMRLEIEMSAMTEEQRRAIDQDLSQVDRTIGQLLEYARPARKPPNRPINLADVVQDILHQEQSHTSQVGLTLSIKAHGGTYCLIDRQDFSRCLLNLIENARRYGIAPSQPDNVIEVVLQTRNNRVYVDIRDRGPGIAPEDIARLMRPFSRGDTARTGGTGAGLGLSIVERLVSPAGGRLRLLPREGGGLTARLDLPRARRIAQKNKLAQVAA
jgi:two-component system osmolarity sensor histidine kinase EnvZ